MSPVPVVSVLLEGGALLLFLADVPQCFTSAAVAVGQLSTRAAYVTASHVEHKLLMLMLMPASLMRS